MMTFIGLLFIVVAINWWAESGIVDKPKHNANIKKI